MELIGGNPAYSSVGLSGTTAHRSSWLWSLSTNPQETQESFYTHWKGELESIFFMAFSAQYNSWSLSATLRHCSSIMVSVLRGSSDGVFTFAWQCTRSSTTSWRSSLPLSPTSSGWTLWWIGVLWRWVCHCSLSLGFVELWNMSSYHESSGSGGALRAGMGWSPSRWVPSLFSQVSVICLCYAFGSGGQVTCLNLFMLKQQKVQNHYVILQPPGDFTERQL